MGLPRLWAIALLMGGCSFNDGGLGLVRNDAGDGGGGDAGDGGGDAADAPPGVTHPVEVEIMPSGGGVVRSVPAGLDCMDRCSRAFPANQTVVLTATAGSGRQFLGWAGDCTGAFACTANVAGPRRMVARFGAAGQHLWSRQGGGTGGNDTATDVAIDAAGDVLVVGHVYGAADFGAGPTTDKGGGDAFVAKYSAAGDLLWLRRFGALGFDSAEGVAVAPGGDVYVVGRVQYDVDFGAGVVAGDGLNDAFIARFAGASGAVQFAKRLSTTATAVFYDVAATATGAVFTGSVAGSGTFEGRPVSASVGSDVISGAISATGTVTAATTRAGSGSGDFGDGIAIDPAGNLVLVGGFNGTVELGGQALVTAGNHDVFVARYRPTGEHDWSFRYGGADTDYANAMALDGDEPVVVGTYQGAVSLGGAALPGLGTADMFVARYSSGGAHQWSKGFGGNGNEDELRGVAVGTGGTILVTGRFGGMADFGAGTVNSAGQNDIVAMGFTAAGSRLWTRTFGQTGADAGRGIAALGETFVLVGTKEGAIDFGGGALPDLLRNVFVARLRP